MISELTVEQIRINAEVYQQLNSANRPQVVFVQGIRGVGKRTGLSLGIVGIHQSNGLLVNNSELGDPDLLKKVTDSGKAVVSSGTPWEFGNFLDEISRRGVLINLAVITQKGMTEAETLEMIARAGQRNPGKSIGRGIPPEIVARHSLGIFSRLNAFFYWGKSCQ